MSVTASKPKAGSASLAKGSRGAKVGIVRQVMRGTTGRAALAPARLIQVIEAGLPVAELRELQRGLGVPQDKLASLLGISKATLHRHKGAGQRLTPAVSDRVLRYSRLLARAVEVLGDEPDARQWLNGAQFGLGGAVPMDYAKTEVGAREVENLLGRIEHGVYS